MKKCHTFFDGENEEPIPDRCQPNSVGLDDQGAEVGTGVVLLCLGFPKPFLEFVALVVLDFKGEAGSPGDVALIQCPRKRTAFSERKAFGREIFDYGTLGRCALRFGFAQ